MLANVKNHYGMFCKTLQYFKADQLGYLIKKKNKIKSLHR